MRVSIPGRINQACLELFNETAAVAMPRLMRELETPQRIAGKLDVTTTAVRRWFTSRDWYFDPETSQWVAPQAEVEHAPAV